MGKLTTLSCAGFLLSWVAAAVVFIGDQSVQARPRYKHNLGRYYGDLLPARLNACTTCHLSTVEVAAASTSKAIMPPHNAFGARLKLVGEELATQGRATELSHRLELTRDEDADGDGIANETEILAGSAPGDAADRPSGELLEKTAVGQAVLARSRSPYPWSAFQPVTRPQVPAPRDANWSRNCVDDFVASRREQANLSPRPQASRQVLLRRVHLDLTGLAPAPAELAAFVSDDSPDAYERVVDRLLASPAHGERWARHWMDVWRYSDWAGWGEQVRDSQPNVWRWRDWIVESLNRDQGYDRMLVEMLAGDELAPEDAGTLRATGYLVRSFKLLSREAWMQEAVDHCAQAFLGLTLGCARCHDHMYDPLSQQEYYEFRAIFEPYQVRLDRLPGRPDPIKDGLARAFDANLDARTYLFLRGDDRFPVKETPLQARVPAVLGGSQLEPQAVNLPLTAYAPDKLPHVVAEAREAAEQAIVLARDAFKAAVLEASRPEHVTAALAQGKAATAEMAVALAEARRDALVATLRVEAMEDAGGKNQDVAAWTLVATEAARTQRWARLLEARRGQLLAALELQRLEAEKKPEGELGKAREALANAEKELAGAREAALAPPTTEYTRRDMKIFPAASTGRRLALARWLTDRKNPLVARVAVNHIWLRHFGQAIVPSVNDFGLNGRRPTHPELLDWLAAELMHPGDAPAADSSSISKSMPASWSMKRLHRLLVTSNTYRLGSTPDPASRELDPDNVFLWRMSSRRLEAESVRDNVFHAASLLDSKLGGRELDQKLLLTTPRRSLYFRHAAEKQAEFLQVFDMAQVGECYERRTSVVPQQALALANSELVMTCARALARELATTSVDPGSFSRRSFLRVLAREPTPLELDAALEYLAEETSRFEAERANLGAAVPGNDLKRPSVDPRWRAGENLVHALFNHNDFVTVR